MNYDPFNQPMSDAELDQMYRRLAPIYRPRPWWLRLLGVLAIWAICAAGVWWVVK